MTAARLHTFKLEPAPGAHIAVDHLEGTEPPLCFLHGLTSVRVGEKSTALLEFARRRGLACYRFDFRGHGESSGELQDTTLTELIEDSVAVLERAGRGSILVGSSLGGLVAAWTAAERPDLVASVTLLAPAFEFLPRLMASMNDDESVALPDGSARLRLSPRVVEDLGHHDESELPRRLTMPVLIVHGQHDDTVPVEVSHRFFAAIPHERKELWVLPDGDHRLNRPIERIFQRMAQFAGL